MSETVNGTLLIDILGFDMIKYQYAILQWMPLEHYEQMDFTLKNKMFTWTSEFDFDIISMITIQ
jgi:hypothetical protein